MKFWDSCREQDRFILSNFLLQVCFLYEIVLTDCQTTINKKHMKCFRRTEECIEYFKLYGLKVCIFVVNIIILGSKLMTKWGKYENIYAL
jgi:hypothetical protein